MNLEQVPLARQIDMAFKEMKEELIHLNSGTVLFQIRNNVIGKFGVKHLPLESKGGQFVVNGKTLSESHYQVFRQIAIDSLKYKKNWTHGEICMDFMLRQDMLSVSVQFESNYNMSSLSGRAL